MKILNTKLVLSEVEWILNNFRVWSTKPRINTNGHEIKELSCENAQ